MRYLSTSMDLKTLIFLQPAADYRILGMAARHIKPGIGGALVANRNAAKDEKFVPRNGFFAPMTAVTHGRAPRRWTLSFTIPCGITM
jgi:hypothetical protein